MLILAFDTSLQSCSLTLSKNREVLTENIVFQDVGSSEIIIPMLQEQIEKAKIRYKDLNFIGISIGPGSYTGIRVGISVAKGLSLALKIPIVGISSLNIMAYEASKFLKSELEIVVANKARRDEVYFQHFSSEAEPKSAPRRVNITELNILLSEKKYIFTGNIVEEISSIINKNRVILYEGKASQYLPSTVISNILNDLIDSGSNLDNYPPEPIYLNEKF